MTPGNQSAARGFPAGLVVDEIPRVRIAVRPRGLENPRSTGSECARRNSCAAAASIGGVIVPPSRWQVRFIPGTSSAATRLSPSAKARKQSPCNERKQSHFPARCQTSGPRQRYAHGIAGQGEKAVGAGHDRGRAPAAAFNPNGTAFTHFTGNRVDLDPVHKGSGPGEYMAHHATAYAAAREEPAFLERLLKNCKNLRGGGCKQPASPGLPATERSAAAGAGNRDRDEKRSRERFATGIGRIQ